MSEADSESETGSGIERRRAVRKMIRTRVTLTQGENQFSVQSFDVSIGGIGLILPINPPYGLIVSLRFVIPKKPRGTALVEATGKVVHSIFSADEDGFKVGVNFTSLNDASKAALIGFLS